MLAIHHLRIAPFVFVLTLAVSLAGIAGCTQVQVSPDSVGEYRLGELQVFADRDFATVYESAKRGIKDLGLMQTRDDRKVVEAELNARDSSDTLVIVKIKEVGANRTSVKIRYGYQGNLSQAQKLYQAIEKRY